LVRKNYAKNFNPPRFTLTAVRKSIVFIDES